MPPPLSVRAGWRYQISKRLARPDLTILLIVLLGSAAFGAVHAHYAIKRHENFDSRGDTACLNQVISRTADGHFFEAPYCWSVHQYYSGATTFEPQPLPDDASYMGLHPTLIILPLAAVYKIVPGVITLLVLSAIFVSAGAPLVYLLARKRTQSTLLSVGFAVSYLLHPATSSSIVGEFHPDQAFVPLFLGAVTAFAYSRQRLFLALAVMALVMKESTTPVIAGLALFTVFARPREWRFGLALFLVAAGWWLLLFRVVIPRESIYGFYIFESLYGTPLGGNFEQVLRNSLTSPRLLLNTVNTHANGQFLFDLQSPFLFLSALSPLTYPAQLASIFASMVTSNPSLKLMGHYSTVPLPIAVWAAVEGAAFLRLGMARLAKLAPQLEAIPHRRPALLVLTATLALALPFAAYSRDDRAEFTLTREPHREAFQSSPFTSLNPVLACIREDDYLATIDQLAAHTAARRVTWPLVALDETTVLVAPEIAGFAVSPELLTWIEGELSPRLSSYHMNDGLKTLVMVKRGAENESCIAGAVARYNAATAGPATDRDRAARARPLGVMR